MEQGKGKEFPGAGTPGNNDHAQNNSRGRAAEHSVNVCADFEEAAHHAMDAFEANHVSPTLRSGTRD